MDECRHDNWDILGGTPWRLEAMVRCIDCNADVPLRVALTRLCERVRELELATTQLLGRGQYAKGEED